MRSVELKRLDRLISQLVEIRNSVQLHFEVDFEIEADLESVEIPTTSLYQKIREEVENIS